MWGSITRSMPSAFRAAAAPARSYYMRTGICATARLPGRLEKEHLPFYFTPSPDDRDEHVEQFTPEDKKERQQWIDKIISMADSNEEPDLAVYEGVLKLLVKQKDNNGAKLILNTLEELGLRDKANAQIVADAVELAHDKHIKSYWDRPTNIA